MLIRYFPEDTNIPKNENAFSTLLDDIILSQEKLDTEKPLVIKIYSIVCTLGIAANLLLLNFMLYTPYRSTTAVFLFILMILNLHESCAIMINLFYLNQHDYPLQEIATSQPLNQLQSLVWSLSSIIIMLLVALDRWAVHNIPGTYLFKHHRKMKVGCSLAMIAMLVTIVNYNLPLTVQMQLPNREKFKQYNVANERIQVFICITHSCQGSPLLMHKWRSSKDRRRETHMKLLLVWISLITTFFLPIYGCIWNAVQRKAQSDKQYENERAKITQRGQEVVYFNDIHEPNWKPASDLPVIYEVDEENENVLDKGIVFPYTLQILHKACSLCSLTNKNNLLYDDKPVPENAQPMIVKNFVTRRYDSHVDRPPIFRATHKRAKFSRLAVKPKFPRRRSSLDFNRNALPPTSVRDRSLVHTSSAVPPPTGQVQVETCHHCRYKKHVHHHKDALSTRQIVFSINCCCNKGAPIDYYTEIIYLNGGDYCGSTRPSIVSHDANCSVNVESEERCNISYKNTYNPVSTNLQDATVNDTNRWKIPGPGSLQLLHQEDPTAMEVTKNHSYANYQQHRDWERRSLPSGEAASSSRFPEVDSALKTSTKPCQVINQVTYIPTPPVCGNYDLGAERLTNQSCKQPCKMCQKPILANANWNNDFLPNKKRKGSNNIHNRQPSHIVDGVPTVAFKSLKSQSIMQVIKDYYVRHPHHLKPIGIPSSLSIHETARQTQRTKAIINRMMFATVCYFGACIIPGLTEAALLPYSTVLYMSSSFRVLIQFISLFIFSHDFRSRIRRRFSWRK